MDPKMANFAMSQKATHEPVSNHCAPGRRGLASATPDPAHRRQSAANAWEEKPAPTAASRDERHRSEPRGPAAGTGTGAPGTGMGDWDGTESGDGWDWDEKRWQPGLGRETTRTGTSQEGGGKGALSVHVTDQYQRK